MKPGPKPKGNVVARWSSNFAYAIGLLTADGCVSKDGRHIDFTSKDESLVLIFQNALGLTSKISRKSSGAGNFSYHTQFSDVLFHEFLRKIGIGPAKSKTIRFVDVPKKYFCDFLRGYFDGDGCSFSYFDPVWKNSFRFYISFMCGSLAFLEWLQTEIEAHVAIRGSINHYKDRPYAQLRYSKKEAAMLADFLYRDPNSLRLERKYLKIMDSLGIIGKCRGGEIGRRATFRS